MRILLRSVNAVVDTCLAWFTPLWRRQAHEAASLISRYMHQYRPSIKPEKMAEYRAVHKGLSEALLYWRKQDAQALVEQVKTQYDNLPGFRRSMWVEMVESLFVITVVFLGIRTYYVQPFRIPTNSMWPSLNGIVVHPLGEGEIPSLAQRVWESLTLGSSYVDVKAETPKRITDVRDERKWVLFSETILSFDDGSKLSIPAASGAVIQYLRDREKLVDTPRGMIFLTYYAGEPIMRARVDAGDMVLVNRMAYHFRRPERGETFVFDTRGINTSSSSMKEQSGGTHFIKRLAGLPGDSISIHSPHLIVNGSPAKEPGLARVAAAQPPYNSSGYIALNPYRVPTAYLPMDRTVTLAAEIPGKPWLREYLALGDNTLNSLDSRYWGPVRQFNILGPASFTLWPFTWHWGSIE